MNYWKYLRGTCPNCPSPTSSFRSTSANLRVNGCLGFHGIQTSAPRMTRRDVFLRLLVIRKGWYSEDEPSPLRLWKRPSTRRSYLGTGTQVWNYVSRIPTACTWPSYLNVASAERHKVAWRGTCQQVATLFDCKAESREATC